jgi:hypothetical protein
MSVSFTSTSPIPSPLLMTSTSTTSPTLSSSILMTSFAQSDAMRQIEQELLGFAQLKQKLADYKKERERLAGELQQLENEHKTKEADRANDDVDKPDEAEGELGGEDGELQERASDGVGFALQKMDLMQKIVLLDQNIQALTTTKEQQLPHIKQLHTKILEMKRTLR